MSIRALSPIFFCLISLLFVEEEIPPAPPLAAPSGATVLFDGTDASAWHQLEPRAEEDTGGGKVEWKIDKRALVVSPGLGDIVTREEFGDYHLHLDFLVPDEPPTVSDELRGASGVFVSGRWEIALLDSHEKDTHNQASGAILGQHSPVVNASKPPGTWQTLDVTYQHHKGEPARVSVWLNDVRVQDDVELDEHTSLGFRSPIPGSTDAGHTLTMTEEGPESEALDFGARSFAVHARFRSSESGTLVSKCPAEGAWVPDAKVLFLRGGHLVYDIGWVGALESENRWNDDEWHDVVLTSDNGLARIFVDGQLEAERDDFRADDEEHFVLKIGDANENFGGTYSGEIERAAFFGRRLSTDEAIELSEGKEAGGAPEFSWERDADASDPVVLLEPGDLLTGPIRLQAEGSPVRFANIWVRPLAEVDHTSLIASWGPESYARGEEIYGGLCILCHGADGRKPTNPKARPFALGLLENGSDPLRLFETITNGYKEMPSNAWLRPDQRYDVVHYLRERFLRDENPSQYFEVTDAWLNALPKGKTGVRGTPAADLAARDYGPALASQLGPEIGAGLSVRLDEDLTLGYDLQTMQSPGVWQGAFLELETTQHYQQRGESIVHPGAETLPGLDGWGWGFGGELDWDRDERPERGPLPAKWLDYHGRHVFGDSVVLTYAIDGREVLELPGVDRSSGFGVVTHRLRIAPGERALVLGVLRSPTDTAPAAWNWEGEGAKTWPTFVAGDEEDLFAAATFRGPATARVEGERLVLDIPASEEPLELWILRTAGEGTEHLVGFERFLDNAAERPLPPSPMEYTGGGPLRWDEVLVTRGEVAAGDGYVLDTLTLPESNPWNAWLRTSALDFFEDGRAAVATYGGDVWIVSGIDEGLEQLSWKRFAAGMFEPMGLRIVDGLVHVTCRDRIVRLHDLDRNGEADFYESFFSDPDVTASFHSFNFDLQTDAEGNFFYAKSGQYTDYALPGAILKVAPDGASYEVFCTGLRTPNGMGISPDGRPLVSDNQGNWIPASKISLTRKDGFYGVFKSINTNGAGKQTRDDFDPPVVWMPQKFDSSCGGQLFVDDPRWGPLAGRFVHTSFGKGWMSVLMIDDSREPAQGAVYRLPFQFAAGIQRARVNPADGQVYSVGLSGWQGPAGGADGCLQRVRWAGGSHTYLLETKVHWGGLELRFNAPLDRESASSTESFEVKRWNYRWARSYGSSHYSVENPGEVGEDTVKVKSVSLSPDGKKIFIQLPGLEPVDQMEVRIDLKSAQGEKIETDLFLTINRVPDA